MSDKYLNIISFDVPYPPDYGGVIDVFYKIKSLKEAGIKIILHCFKYGRKESERLEEICENVYYYKREFTKKIFFKPNPYIVVTRSSAELLKNLLGNAYPILFEGLHCCYFLSDSLLKDRIKLVRMHNIEQDYYNNLAGIEKSLFRRFYFKAEAKKLKRFESILHCADHILAISPSDQMYLKQHYSDVTLIPAFHPNESVGSATGQGFFALYHGNLAVGENNEAALYLVNKVFNTLSVPLIIAGSNPSKELAESVKKYKHIQLRFNITLEQMNELIRSAQVHVLPTFQATGIKLKLLSALFNGRHCIVNDPMVSHTGLESLCSIQNDPESMKSAIVSLFEKAFDLADIKKREMVLMKLFSNRNNALKLIGLLH